MEEKKRAVKVMWNGSEFVPVEPAACDWKELAVSKDGCLSFRIVGESLLKQLEMEMSSRALLHCDIKNPFESMRVFSMLGLEGSDKTSSEQLASAEADIKKSMENAAAQLQIKPLPTKQASIRCFLEPVVSFHNTTNPTMFLDNFYQFFLVSSSIPGVRSVSVLIQPITCTLTCYVEKGFEEKTGAFLCKLGAVRGPLGIWFQTRETDIESALAIFDIILGSEIHLASNDAAVLLHHCKRLLLATAKTRSDLDEVH